MTYNVLSGTLSLYTTQPSSPVNLRRLQTPLALPATLQSRVLNHGCGVDSPGVRILGPRIGSHTTL